MAKQKNLFIVGIVTDKPDSWEIIAKKESKGMQFTIDLADTRLSKPDTKFINSNIKRFALLEGEIKEGQVLKENA